MANVLGRFKMDAAAWKQMIESHAEAGLHLKQLWRNADQPEEILFLFEAEDLERARSFLQAAGALDEEKQKRGEIPQLVFLDPA